MRLTALPRFVALLAVSAHLALAPAGLAIAASPRPDGAWADLKDPARKIVLRDGKLWLIEADRVRIAFPIVGGSGEKLEICWTDARATLTLSELGPTLTLKGPLAGEFHRLSAMPPELDLRPLPLAAPKPLPPQRVEEIQKEMARRGDLDQKFRTRVEGDDNTSYLKGLIAEVGWIDRTRFGADANLSAFLIVQHSDDIPFMLTALPEIRREMKPGEPKDASSNFYALLYDRLTLALGGLQRYGTQIGVQPSGRQVLRGLEDPEHVDQRRKDLGMEPLAAYVTRFGVAELPRIDEHCREVGFIKGAPSSPPAARPASSAGRAPEDLLPGAWQDQADPAHRIALRDGKLWISEKGRLKGALPVVASEPGRLWICAKEGNRRAIDVSMQGGVATLKGEEEGSYSRLEAVPAELVLLPLDLPEPRPLAAPEVEKIRKELAQRGRYTKLPIGSTAALDRSRIEERIEARIEEIDAENSAYLRRTVAEVGWIDEIRFGPAAALAALGIVQHSADLRLVQTALPEIRKRLGTKPDPLLADTYARLYDRFQLATGGLQRYGTQLGLLADRRQVVRPLENPPQVDDRRRELGLGPLADELARSGATEAVVLDARCQPLPPPAEP